MSSPKPRLPRQKGVRTDSRNTRPILQLRPPDSSAVQADPVTSATQAGLSHVSDERRGIRRLRAGRAFKYLDAGGKTVHDRAVLGRIKSLAVPPAWTDVW